MTRLVSPFIVALGLVWAVPAFAQPTEEAEVVPQREQAVDLTADIFGAYDRAVGSRDEELAASRERTYWGGNTQLTFDRRSGRFTLNGGAGVSVRRLSDVSDGLLPSYSGTINLGGPLSRRTTWTLSQGLSWAPANAATLIGPGDIVTGVQSVPLVDYRLADDKVFSTTTRGGVSYGISRRGMLTASVGYDRSRASDSGEEGVPSIGAFQRWDVSGRYTHRTTRYASWYAGYGISENRVGEEIALTTAPRGHNLDVGVSYGRPLSFSRRTRIATQVGATVLTNRISGSRQWRVNGSASVQHELGRSWRAELAFQRDTQYLAAFADAVNGDAVTVSVAGNLSQRSSLSMLANRAGGRVGLATDGNGYTLTSASVTYRYAFLRGMATYFQYFLFDSDFDGGVTVAGTAISSAQRHGVRFGVSIGTGLWGNRRTMGLPLSGESSR